VTRSLALTLFASMATATSLVVLAAWGLASPDADLGGVLLRAWLGALVVCAVLASVLARWLGDPLEEIRTTAHGLATGDLTRRSRSQRRDAIGELGRAVDRMADQLADRIERVREEKARLRTIVDAMVEAVLVTDEAGTIIMSNAALDALVGRDARGSTILAALRSPELGDAVGRAAQGRSARVSFELRTARGERALTAQVAPLPEGAGVITVVHDVTELRRADSVRRDFVANASHELRTPLTSIRGFAETLLDGAIDDPTAARRFARGIADNAVRLQQLVDDLLELSRAESPDAVLELEPVSAHEVATRVARSLEARALERETTVTVTGPREEAWCLAEPRSLDHVLTNLVENAIKYGRRSGHVEVRIEPAGEQLRVEVRDDGPGIAPQHLPRIFERFYRVDPGRARDQGGTGLGLSIVRHLVTRMHGEVTVESRLGKGTAFVVTLTRPRVSLSDWSDEVPTDEPAG
jgi:two-component system phosphate regulon sensor histidine kinase PhoR